MPSTELSLETPYLILCCPVDSFVPHLMLTLAENGTSTLSVIVGGSHFTATWSLCVYRIWSPGHVRTGAVLSDQNKTALE